jgi:hypothetical protein
LDTISKLDLDSQPSIHIISFDVPYPANYGGVMDVFYKIKNLHALGTNIILHCYDYGRGEQKILENYCTKVFYYKRKKSFVKHFSKIPFIVKSRASLELLGNLKKDDFPILFEGLHSCAFIDHPDLQHRFKIYRESNIEHVYYFKLSKAESSYMKKLYFYIEALKLETYEKVLRSANKLLLVSQSDCDYFAKKFGKEKTIYLPSFHPNEKISCQTGKGQYALYHGNLSVPENNVAAIFLVKKVFALLDIPFKIAGMDPSSNLVELCKKYPNMELIANPSNEVMNQLIESAHINCLYTHQATGLKLKLINVLFRGRFCLTNTDMLEGSNLEDLCVIADNQITYADQVKKLFQKEFSMSEIEKRKTMLSINYDNQAKAKVLYELIKKRN